MTLEDLISLLSSNPKPSLLPPVQETIELLAANMEISPTGCFLWTGLTNNKGYGYTSRDFVERFIHRLSYKVLVGSTNHLQVLHACDIPLCFNPDHLFLGTQLDNVQDMRNKGRGFVPTCGHRKTLEYTGLLSEMQRLREQGMTYRKIATKLGVSDSTVRKYLKKFGTTEWN